MKNNILIVGGTWEKTSGKPSKIINELYEGFHHCNGEISFGKITLYNGGSFDNLSSIFDTIHNYDAVIWMPNVSNNEDKILPKIKQKYPHVLLIGSKRMFEKDYTYSDVVGLLLKNHCNLGICIEKDSFAISKKDYEFTLLDPLGNRWFKAKSMFVFSQKLFHHIIYLFSLTRIPSKSITETTQRRVGIVDNTFIECVQKYGKKFDEFITAVNPNRLLGNAATRCCSGFPAFRSQNDRDVYYISQRNIDKANIGAQNFVRVCTTENVVEYFGEKKPSVDSPIQIRLFNYYHNVNYIIHGHVYIKNAKKTSKNIPCGYIEEFDEIKKLHPNKTDANFCINLLGHGCLILANELSYLESRIWDLESRPMPEYAPFYFGYELYEDLKTKNSERPFVTQISHSIVE